MFSPDSRGVAYSVSRRSAAFVVLDGRPGPAVDSIGAYTMTFSPNSRGFAYGAFRNGKRLVVVDGIESQEFSCVQRNLAFSPDSRHFAYSAASGSKGWFVVDGVKSIEHDGRGICVLETSRLLRGIAARADANFNDVFFRIEAGIHVVMRCKTEAKVCLEGLVNRL